MAVEKGAKPYKATKGVPFPQYDYPGSKISPFTGKAYTKAEAKDVHNKTHAQNLRINRGRKISGEKKKLGERSATERARHLSMREKIMAFSHNNDSAAHRANSRLEYAKANPNSGKRSNPVAAAAARRLEEKKQVLAGRLDPKRRLG